MFAQRSKNRQIWSHWSRLTNGNEKDESCGQRTLNKCNPFLSTFLTACVYPYLYLSLCLTFFSLVLILPYVSTGVYPHTFLSGMPVSLSTFLTACVYPYLCLSLCLTFFSFVLILPYVFTGVYPRTFLSGMPVSLSTFFTACVYPYLYLSIFLTFLSLCVYLPYHLCLPVSTHLHF